jgi:cytochrome-b5 reductase
MDAATRIKTKTPSPYQLTAIEIDTHDTKTFRFALPADATLDMLPGDYLYVHATINGKPVKRPYTPSSLPGTTGSFDLTVKRYETGVVSKYLHDQHVGSTVLMSGPNPGGHWVDGMAKRVGFVAGGTGITPMISIIRWILTKRIDADLFLSWSSRLRDGRRESDGLRSISCANIFLLPPLIPVFFSVARRRWSMPWKPHSKSLAIQSSRSFSRE